MERRPVELSGRVNQQGSSFLELKAASLPLDDLSPLIKTRYPQVQMLAGKVASLEVSLSSNKGDYYLRRRSQIRRNRL